MNEVGDLISQLPFKETHNIAKICCTINFFCISGVVDLNGFVNIILMNKWTTHQTGFNIFAWVVGREKETL